MDERICRATVGIDAFGGESKFGDVVDRISAHIWLDYRFHTSVSNDKGMWVECWHVCG